jgi:hypothetical protein
MSTELAISAIAALALAAGVSSSASGSRASTSTPARPRGPTEPPRLLFDEQADRLRAVIEEVAAASRAHPAQALQPGDEPVLGAIARFAQTRQTQERAEQIFRKHKLSPELLRTLLIQSMVDYVANGRQSFVVGPRLQEMFTQTSLPDQVEQWMLQTPYPAFYVALPGCQEQIWGTYNTMSLVRGVMVDTEFLPGHMALLLWAPLPIEKIAAHHGLDLRQLGPDTIKQLRAQGNDAYLIFDIEEAVADPRGLEVHILDQWEQRVKAEGWSQHAIDATAKSRVNILKIVLGTILYLQSERKELSADPAAAQARAERAELEARLRNTKTPAKRRKIEEKIGAIPTGGTITYLGRTIEASPDEPGDEGGTGEARALRRHWVRGHWRRPARKHGPRVLVWIQPFLRGIGEPVPSRTYKLEDV